MNHIVIGLLLACLFRGGYEQDDLTPIRIVFVNDMSDAATLKIQSEAREEGKEFEMIRGQRLPLRLVSPDRYQVEIEDNNGVSFSKGLLSLRQIASDHPGKEFSLKGQFGIVVSYIAEQDPRTKQVWLQQVTQRQRTHVFIDHLTREIDPFTGGRMVDRYVLEPK